MAHYNIIYLYDMMIFSTFNFQTFHSIFLSKSKYTVKEPVQFARDNWDLSKKKNNFVVAN